MGDAENKEQKRGLGRRRWWAMCVCVTNAQLWIDGPINLPVIHRGEAEKPFNHFYNLFTAPVPVLVFSDVCH